MENLKSYELKIFEGRLEMATHNLLCYSSNMLMTQAKQGYEKEYAATKNEIEKLQMVVKAIKEELQTA
jgi:hypothetical protein